MAPPMDKRFNLNTYRQVARQAQNQPQGSGSDSRPPHDLAPVASATNSGPRPIVAAELPQITAAHQAGPSVPHSVQSAGVVQAHSLHPVHNTRPPAMAQPPAVARPPVQVAYNPNGYHQPQTHESIGLARTGQYRDHQQHVPPPQPGSRTYTPAQHTAQYAVAPVSTSVSVVDQVSNRVLQVLAPALNQIHQQQNALFEHFLKSSKSLEEIMTQLSQARIENETLARRFAERDEADKKGKQREVDTFVALGLLAERVKDMGNETKAILKVLGRKDGASSLNTAKKSVLDRLDGIQMDVQEFLERVGDPEADGPAQPPRALTPPRPAPVVLRHDMATSPIKIPRTDIHVSNSLLITLSPPLSPPVPNQQAHVSMGVGPSPEPEEHESRQNSYPTSFSSRNFFSHTLVGDRTNTDITMNSDTTDTTKIASVSPRSMHHKRGSSIDKMDMDLDDDPSLPSKKSNDCLVNQIHVSSPSPMSPCTPSRRSKSRCPIGVDEAQRMAGGSRPRPGTTFSPVDWSKTSTPSNRPIARSFSVPSILSSPTKDSGATQALNPSPKRSYTLPPQRQGSVAALRQEATGYPYPLVFPLPQKSPLKQTSNGGAAAEAAERMLSPESQCGDETDKPKKLILKLSPPRRGTGLSSSSVSSLTEFVTSESSDTTPEPVGDGTTTNDVEKTRHDSIQLSSSPLQPATTSTPRSETKIKIRIPARSKMPPQPSPVSPIKPMDLSSVRNAADHLNAGHLNSSPTKLNSSPSKPLAYTPPPESESSAASIRTTDDEDVVQSIVTSFARSSSPALPAPISSPSQSLLKGPKSSVDLLSPLSGKTRKMTEIGLNSGVDDSVPRDVDFAKLRGWYTDRARQSAEKKEEEKEETAKELEVEMENDQQMIPRAQSPTTPRVQPPFVASSPSPPAMEVDETERNENIGVVETSEQEQDQDSSAPLDFPPPSPLFTSPNHSPFDTPFSYHDENFDLHASSSPVDEKDEISLPREDTQEFDSLPAVSSPRTASLEVVAVSSPKPIDSQGDDSVMYVSSAMTTPVKPSKPTLADAPPVATSFLRTSPDKKGDQKEQALRRSPSVIYISSDSSDDESAPAVPAHPKVTPTVGVSVKVEPDSVEEPVAAPEVPSPPAPAQEEAPVPSSEVPLDPLEDLFTRPLSPISDLSDDEEPEKEENTPFDAERFTASLTDDDAEIVRIKKPRRVTEPVRAPSAPTAAHRRSEVSAKAEEIDVAMADLPPPSPAPRQKRSLLALPKKGQSAATTRVKKRKQRPEPEVDDEDEPPLKLVKLRKKAATNGLSRVASKGNVTGKRQVKTPSPTKKGASATVKVQKTPTSQKTQTRRPRNQKPRSSMIVWPRIDEPNFDHLVKCDTCDGWYHIGCVGMLIDDVRLSDSELYQCPPCEAGVDRSALSPTKGGKDAIPAAGCARPSCLRPKKQKQQAVKEEETFAVESFVGKFKKFVGGKGLEIYYLVKWHDYDFDECTWETLESMALANATLLIESFEKVADKEGLDLESSSNDALLLKCASKAGWQRDLQFVRPKTQPKI